jgi:hypothetical protein
MTNPTSAAELAERLDAMTETARAVCSARDAEITRLRAELAAANERAVEAEGLAERLLMEAQHHAGEARCHKSSLHEAYQACSGATGEPGNWHGANPVRDAIATLTAERDGLKRALAPFADLGDLLELETEGFVDGDLLDVSPAIANDVKIGRLSFGQFRHAREALALRSDQEGVV